LVPSKTVAACAGPIAIAGGVDMRAHPEIPGWGADLSAGSSRQPPHAQAGNGKGVDDFAHR